MPGMTMLPAVRDTAPDLSANEFEVEYIAEDGTRHRAPLADVRADARRGRPRRRTSRSMFRVFRRGRAEARPRLCGGDCAVRSYALIRKLRKATFDGKLWTCRARNPASRRVLVKSLISWPLRVTRIRDPVASIR